MSETKPLSAEDARIAWIQRDTSRSAADVRIAGGLDAIALRQHKVIDTATHEAVTREELAACQREIERLQLQRDAYEEGLEVERLATEQLRQERNGLHDELLRVCSLFDVTLSIGPAQHYVAELVKSRIERLQSQLPEGMKHCTIQFKECEKGHGRLVAANWIDHGCQQCEIERLQQERDAYKKEADLNLHRVITCGVAATHPDPTLTTRGAYAGKWDTKQHQEVRALRDDRDRLQQDLAQEKSRLAESDRLLGAYAHKATVAEQELAKAMDESGDHWATIIGIQSLSENWATGITSAQESMIEIHRLLKDAARSAGGGE